MASFVVNLNTARNAFRELPHDAQIAAARPIVKLCVAARGAELSLAADTIPDFLASDAAVKRYLEIEPPIAAVIPEFQEIVDEIEKAYVGVHGTC